MTAALSPRPPSTVRDIADQNDIEHLVRDVYRDAATELRHEPLVEHASTARILQYVASDPYAIICLLGRARLVRSPVATCRVRSLWPAGQRAS